MRVKAFMQVSVCAIGCRAGANQVEAVADPVKAEAVLFPPSYPAGAAGAEMALLMARPARIPWV